MITLPTSTVVNRRVPKDRFYLGRRDGAELKRLFTESVDKIIWSHKLSPQSLNLPPSTEVPEIELFTTTLTTRSVDRRLYEAMDEAVKPHAVLHLFKTADHVEVVLGYRAPGDKAARYYSKSWLDFGAIVLDFTASSIDALYLSLLAQVSGGTFSPGASRSVTAAVADDSRRQVLEDKIRRLEVQLRNEKQTNRRFELSGEIRKLRKQLRGA